MRLFFGTCIYVDAAAFIRKSQGSPMNDESQSKVLTPTKRQKLLILCFFNVKLLINKKKILNCIIHRGVFFL